MKKDFIFTEIDSLKGVGPQLSKYLKKKKIEFHWWGFYNKWVPQENFYYASENCNFEANPEGRMEGTYSRYAQLDDATDSLLYYLMYIIGMLV